ncbi:MAG: hypothetical protein P8X89_22290 [Reinekea sp.]
MDRINLSPYGHCYRPIYQEDSQHIFHPETGQTSGGGAASGASWSYPGQSYQDFNVQPQIPFSPGPDWESALRTPQPMAMEDLIRSPIHQRDGQYTSAGVPASGPWWSQPTPDQLQTYQDFNFPAQISPSLGSDLEHLQPPLQPMVLEDSVQTDASLAPSNPQPAAAPGSSMAPTERLPPVKERFLAGLEAFARGEALVDCSSTLEFTSYINDDGRIVRKGISLCNRLTDAEKGLLRHAIIARQKTRFGGSSEERFLASLDNYAQGVPVINCSATFPSFKAYVTDDGFLQKPGIALRNRMSQKDQERVNDALLSRQQFYLKRVMNNSPVEERFLAGLDNYAQGIPLANCSATLRFHPFVTDDGKLLKRGEGLYKKLSPEDQDRVNKVLATRRRGAAERISGDLRPFLVALEPYSNGWDLQTCGKQSGLKRKVERYLTPEGGLTARGELLIENLPLNEQLAVQRTVEARRQHINPSAQVPESPWQLPEIPASMSEMGRMDPTSMYSPMQTEAMMAAAWQYTGQAMPGIWGMPSESAEPSIPHWPGNRARYADQYPGRGV